MPSIIVLRLWHASVKMHTVLLPAVVSTYSLGQLDRIVVGMVVTESRLGVPKEILTIDERYGSFPFGLIHDSCQRGSKK